MMRVDLEQKIPVGSSSRDEGGPFGNKKFRWGRHHVIRVDLEQKIPVHSSSRDEGGPFGNEKCPLGCHHVMRVDLEQKIPVHSHHGMRVYTAKAWRLVLM